MTKAKSSSPYNPDKNRVAEIKRLKAKVGKQEGKSVATIQNGKPKAIPVYSLPRKFLRLNPANHRFRSSLNSLKKTRLAAKKKRQDIKNPFDFDMADTRGPSSALELGGDVYQIRQMIKGEMPKDAKKKRAFQNLYNAMISHRENFGGSGQKDPGIVTSDGIYINANRRDCVLQQLQDEAAKNKQGGPVDVFKNVDVGICDDITSSDIRRMEMSEQMSIDTRDKFNSIDEAELVHEEYLDTCDDLNVAPKKDGIWNEKAVSEIASVIEGKSKADVIKFLDFYDLSILVLKKLKTPEETWRISIDDPDDPPKSAPIGEYLEEMITSWKSVTGKKKNLEFNKIQTYCGLIWGKARIGSESEDALSHNPTFQAGRGPVRKMMKNSKKFNDTKYYQGLDSTDPDDQEQIADDIESELEKSKQKGALGKPARVLKSIESSLGVISDGLTGTDSKKVAIRLEEAKADKKLKDFSEQITVISKKLKQKLGTQKKSTRKTFRKIGSGRARSKTKRKKSGRIKTRRKSSKKRRR